MGGKKWEAGGGGRAKWDGKEKAPSWGTQR
jgi:hypothetical protein